MMFTRCNYKVFLPRNKINPTGIKITGDSLSSEFKIIFKLVEAESSLFLTLWRNDSFSHHFWNIQP